jgi:hypothetical protein
MHGKGRSPRRIFYAFTGTDWNPNFLCKLFEFEPEGWQSSFAPVQSYFSIESHLLPEMRLASTAIERSPNLHN